LGFFSTGAGKRAAGALESRLNVAQDILKDTTAAAQAEFEPFRDRAIAGSQGLESLITDPTAQKAFIEDNPFFESLATRAREDIFSNKAARGKIGSGGTAEALQNSLLLLGSDLLNTSIGQRGAMFDRGQAAAGSIAGLEQQLGINRANIQGQIGEAVAGGILSKDAGLKSLRNDLISAGTTAATGGFGDLGGIGDFFTGTTRTGGGGSIRGGVPSPGRKPSQTFLG